IAAHGHRWQALLCGSPSIPATRTFNHHPASRHGSGRFWIVYAFSEVVAPSSSQPQLAVALNAARFSYAERQKETVIAERAQTVIDRLLSVIDHGI
ncbi:MAG: hypothetical protein KGM92_00795, partial [Acidobacteriota bacterium]|nr:hypothetical protein [Acidobacteriota bacterium]